MVRGSAMEVGDGQTLDWELLKYKWTPPKGDRADRTNQALISSKRRKRTAQALDANRADEEEELEVGKDYLTRLPQETLDNIFSYFDEPVDLICAKVSCRTLYWAVRAPLPWLQKMSSTFIDVFRIRCALEDPKAAKLQCALCLQLHSRSAFSKRMLAEPDGTHRYCYKATRDGVLEFGLSALTFDSIRRYVSNKKEMDENGYIDYMSFTDEWESYPGPAVVPETQFPLRHVIKNTKFAKVPGLTTIGPNLSDFNVGAVCIDQRLKFKGEHVILKSYVRIQATYRDWIVNHSASVDHTRIMIRANGDTIWWCPHASSRDNPILCNVAWAGAKRMDHSYLAAYCALCQTSMKAYTDGGNNMVIRLKRDLGPMRDEQDPLWLRHVSCRVFKRGGVKRVEELAGRYGNAAWWAMDGVRIEELCSPAERKSRRLRGLGPEEMEEEGVGDGKEGRRGDGTKGGERGSVRREERGRGAPLTTTTATTTAQREEQTPPPVRQMYSIIEAIRRGIDSSFAIIATQWNSYVTP